jgi:hypothetical protein
MNSCLPQKSGEIKQTTIPLRRGRSHPDDSVIPAVAVASLASLASLPASLAAAVVGVVVAPPWKLKGAE